MSRRTDYNLAGCPRYQYLSPRVLPHHRVYVLNKTQVHRLHSSQNAVNHRYAPRAKAFESAINLMSYPVNVVIFPALRRALAVRVFLRRFHLIYHPPGPLDWTPPSGRGSRLDRRGRQGGFGRGKSEEAYSRLGYSRIISG
ncbi:hypothetical protein E4U15_003390 [Claviceps sp. LM218 group G6]|nr:hypothetical protein E4U15_003390 [Claviceps sp. LM218 group G6]KAG6104247.1 hypothetical protein E4U14_005857 [Claviceps sp. LM454 group G7]